MENFDTDKKIERILAVHLTPAQIQQLTGVPDWALYMGTESLSTRGANSDRVPAPLSPGEVISKVIDHYGLTRAEVADILHMSRQMLHAIIHNQKGITMSVAAHLESVIRIPAHVLLRLQADYQLYLFRRESVATDPALKHVTLS